MPSTWIGSNKYQFYKLLVWLNHGFENTISYIRNPCSTDLATAPEWYDYEQCIIIVWELWVADLNDVTFAMWEIVSDGDWNNIMVLMM